MDSPAQLKISNLVRRRCIVRTWKHSKEAVGVEGIMIINELG
jgi:hypothetical protein